jgi:clan AA aspartic protease
MVPKTIMDNEMGLIYCDITISDPVYNELMPVNTKCLVDSGALHLCIPEHLVLQLQLKELEKREFILVDGSRRTCSYVGPVIVKFGNRSCFTGALVIGDKPILGAIPMEDMDLIIHPTLQKLMVNPENPNIPVSILK